MNKDLILKIAKEKDLKSFYKKYPTQEAFMKVHGKAFEKAQFGNMFDKGLNVGNRNVASNIGFNPMSTSLTSSGFETPAGITNVAKNALTSKLPAGVQSMKVPDSIGYTAPKVDASVGVGQVLGAATGVINAAGAFKQQKNKLKDIRQQKGVTDVGLQAAKSIDVDAARQRQDSAAQAREAIMQPIDAGNIAATQGTGTNILAQEGITVSGKPINKKDIRKEKDLIKILPSSSLYPEDEASYVRTTKSLQGLGKRDKKIEQEASDKFVDWYQNPETLKRFGENTGMDPARLQDFVGKALRTPMRPAKDDDYLNSEDNAQWRSPFWQDQNYRTLNKDTGEILYDADATPNIIQHELTHASNLDEVLGPKLKSILGNPTNVFREEKAYIGRPTEAYGNFHEFRTNLGLKPGQKIDEATLKKLTKKKGLDQERFYRAYSPDKITKAINTIAYNNDDDNTTYAQDGAEIQNTYAPDTLYDDLGYEPLEDSTQVKQYKRGGFVKAAGGFSSFMGGGGMDFADKALGNVVDKNAGYQAGKAIGDLSSMIPVVGQIPGLSKGIGLVAGTLGSLADNAFGDAGKIKKEQKALDRNIQDISNVNQAKSITGGLSAMGVGRNGLQLEDGGYMSNDWNPQVIAKFGDHSPEDVYHFAHEGMDSLRAGGHLRSYRDPSEEAMETYAMGGELKTHWGGHMEEMSENPYLPDGGVTYMPHGQSHDESDGNGRTGIGITYGDNPVEVERREPIMKLKDGSTGEDNLVVFGNLEIPKYGVEMLGDKKAKGMKFKNYVSDLSKSEVKQNKTIQKSTEELADLTPRTSFDKLKFAGLQANVLGGNMKLKEIAGTKEKAAALQNAINDTAEEYGIDADSLAKGRVKMVDFDDESSMARKGKKVTKGKPKAKAAPVRFKKPGLAPVEDLDLSVMPKYTRTPEQVAASDARQLRNTMDTMGFGDDYEDEARPISQEVLSEKPKDKFDPYIKALNSIVPYFRPSDAEELDGRQLYGEMYALSQNQEEPVQAQQFSPELINPYSISLQDQMNEITAQTRAAQRMSQGNPAVQAAIAAQAYDAINKVKGEEFRMNQGIANQVQTANVAAMNDAKLKNLGILDQQYTRQAQAKSNTKAITQAALNSISDKYAKNEASNRKLQMYENLYNYRYDDNGRAINMNPLQQWNVAENSSAKSSGTPAAPEGYEYETILKKKAKATAKNGSIVKSIKNL